MTPSRRRLLTLTLSSGFTAATLLAACTDDSTGSPGGGQIPDAALPGFDASARDTATTSDTSVADVVMEAASDAGGDSTVVIDGAIDGGVDAADAAVGTGALSFDGVDDLVIMNGNPSETAFSVELWFKMSPLANDAGYPTQGNMFEVYGKVGGGADRFLFVDAGKACFYVYNPGKGNPKLCSTNTYNDGAWHHIAGTLGSVGGIHVYVDGQDVASDTLTKTSSFTGGDTFRLGYGHFGFSSGFIHFYGAIDEVRVWNVERTGAEILANYNSTVPTNTAGLQGYWKLDETGLSTTAKDDAFLADGGAAGNDGTLVNYVLDGGAASPWVAAR